MRIVAGQLEILEREIVDVSYRAIQFYPGQRSTITTQLFVRLVEMVLVEMQIAESVNKIARDQIDHLRDHHGEQRVGGNVEWDAEEQIGAPLIKLAT